MLLENFKRLNDDLKKQLSMIVMLLKSFRYLVGWLVVFYGITTIVGYVLPNSIYTKDFCE